MEKSYFHQETNINLEEIRNKQKYETINKKENLDILDVDLRISPLIYKETIEKNLKNYSYEFIKNENIEHLKKELKKFIDNLIFLKDNEKKIMINLDKLNELDVPDDIWMLWMLIEKNFSIILNKNLSEKEIYEICKQFYNEILINSKEIKPLFSTVKDLLLFFSCLNFDLKKLDKNLLKDLNGILTDLKIYYDYLLNLWNSYVFHDLHESLLSSSKISEKMEFYKTYLINELFYENNILCLRTNVIDDYFAHVDNIIIDKISGKILFAIDVTSSEDENVIYKKRYRAVKVNSQGGAKITYGLIVKNKKIIPKLNTKAPLVIININEKIFEETLNKINKNNNQNLNLIKEEFMKNFVNDIKIELEEMKKLAKQVNKYNNIFDYTLNNIYQTLDAFQAFINYQK